MFLSFFLKRTNKHAAPQFVSIIEIKTKYKKYKFLSFFWRRTKEHCLSVCFNLYTKYKSILSRDFKWDTSARGALVLRIICDVEFDIEFE